MEIREFAERVERLCEFLLDKVPNSDERNVIFELKEEAIAFQSKRDYSDIFDGLNDHMRGFNRTKES